jgi:hypothetical protein
MAISGAMVWEVRTTATADDLNGGAFLPGALGIDYSQQNAAQKSWGVGNTLSIHPITTTRIIGAGATQFDANDVGNILYIHGGPSFTPGRYEVLSFSGGYATLDRACGVAGSTGGDGRLGGALASPGEAAFAKVASNTIYVKAGTYLLTATPNISGGRVNDTLTGLATAPNRWIGYNATRDDDGTKPVLQANANAMTCFLAAGQHTIIRNLQFTRQGAQTGVLGLNISGLSCHADLILVNNVTGTAAFTVSGQGALLMRCVADGCAGAFNVAVGSKLIACAALDGTSDGFSVSGTGQPVIVMDCLAKGNAGRGFRANHNNVLFVNCTAHGQTGGNGHGFEFVTAFGNNTAINCLSTGNSQRGFNLGDAANKTNWLIKCAAQGNAVATHNFNAVTVLNFITLTVSPYTNAAGEDFSLNNTAGGGADVRGVGLPINFAQTSTSSFPDVGAVQVAAGGSNTFVVQSNTSVVYPGYAMVAY